jgi:hypothetical protein
LLYLRDAVKEFQNVTVDGRREVAQVFGFYYFDINHNSSAKLGDPNPLTVPQCMASICSTCSQSFWKDKKDLPCDQCNECCTEMIVDPIDACKGTSPPVSEFCDSIGKNSPSGHAISADACANPPSDRDEAGKQAVRIIFPSN